MSLPNLDTQQFSEKTLKGFLLKNVEPNTQNPSINELNHFLVKRVDDFWDQVVEPLRLSGKFDGNKINWYFEIYKEGHEARKLSTNPFRYITITEKQVRNMVEFYQGKTLNEYLDLGISFLSNTYTVLTAWTRDQMVLLRLKHIYSSDKPIDWIQCAEDEEHGVMSQKPENIEGIIDVINNIGLIMSRRV